MKYIKTYEEITQDEKSILMDELQTLLETMDVPEIRKNDYRWLLRNLPIRNSNNTNFERAYKIIRKLLK